METDYVAKVIKHYGSQRALARSLCVSDAAVSQWVKNGAIPSGAAVRVERAMRGKVKAVDLVK